MRKPFIPHSLPIDNLQWDKLTKLVGEANRYLSKYNASLTNIINPALLLTTFATKEAVLSSKIEGTQASFEEVLQKDANLKQYSESKVQDIEEIENCKKALEYGIEALKAKPLCLNVIKEMHSILLDSVRGHSKSRGEFRRVQNYIGFAGASIEQASFIPPSPDIMPVSLGEWEKYIHLESEEILVQLAIVHAQFEIIHPFLDGNGRIGRILIPLFLYSKNYLDYPAFYMSEYLESCRSEYYARLKNISENNDWQGWIEFFLRCIIEQANISCNRLQQVTELYKHVHRAVKIEMKTTHYTNEIIDFIFKKPIFTIKDIFEKEHFDVVETIHEHNVTHYTIRRFLENLSRNPDLFKFDIIKGSGTKPAFYRFTSLLDVVNSYS